VFVLMFTLTRIVSRALGVGWVAILFLLSYPWFILWYSFGLAPSCTPILPTCILSDIIAAVDSILPRRIVFPEPLVCDANQTCLRPCTDLQFEGWADPLAFAICDTDLRTCSYIIGLRSTGIPVLDEYVLEPLRTATGRAKSTIQLLDSLAGHRLCTWVSFITAVPVLAAAALVSVAATALVIAAMDMLPSLVDLVCQTAVFYEA
jgi:hypothetical protein